MQKRSCFGLLWREDLGALPRGLPICGGKHRLSPAHLGYRRAVLRQRQQAEQGLPRLPLHPRPPIYRPRQNFDRAYELKRDDQSVREVARRMGFENEIYFFSFFRKKYGHDAPAVKKRQSKTDGISESGVLTIVRTPPTVTEQMRSSFFPEGQARIRSLFRSPVACRGNPPQ